MDFPYGIFYLHRRDTRKNKWTRILLAFPIALRDGAWLLSRITIVFGDLDVLSYIGVRRAALF